MGDATLDAWLDPAYYTTTMDGPLPGWVEEIRPHQAQACMEVLEWYEAGMALVVVDAPTGSGKSLLAEMVRRKLDEGRGVRGLYVNSSKALQDQYVGDFPQAKVLKGRGNYVPVKAWGDVSCADCDKQTGVDDSCSYCVSVKGCPYEQAKASALRSRLAVVNSSYMLTEANYVGGFSGRGFVTVDECDVMERELLGFVEYGVGERMLKELGLEAPRKGARRKTVAGWLEGDMIPALISGMQEIAPGTSDIRMARKRRGMETLLGNTHRVLARYWNDDTEDGEDDSGPWVRDYSGGGAAGLTLKPVTVGEYGADTLWRHGKKWLAMSATVVSAEQWCRDVGVPEEMRWAEVKVPMTFDVENRRVHVVPVASVTWKTKESSYPAIVAGVGEVLRRHPGARVLVHAVSYDLTKALGYGVREITQGREVLWYEDSGGKDAAIEKFRRSVGGVLVAPSLDRGVDFKGDECDVVVVAKVPYPSLGDKQISARLRSPGGQSWYNVQTVRTIVQMTGRHVRSEKDVGVSYVLDSQFGDVWKQNKGLFPEWWREAVTRSISPAKFTNNNNNNTGRGMA